MPADPHTANLGLMNTPRIVFSLVALLLIIGATPRQAVAQSTAVVHESPTLGVRLPAISLVDHAHGAALETNPGALGALGSWGIGFVHSENRSDARILGTGSAIFAAARLPFLSALVIGFGGQWLRPPSTSNYPDLFKFSFGLALAPSPRLALGFSVHSFSADAGSPFDALRSVDLGLIARPTEWIGLGLAVRDLNGPSLDGYTLQRNYDAELIIRPLSTRRLELGAAVRIGERRGDVDPRFRLQLEPLSGLLLQGQVELFRRDYLNTGHSLNDIRATVGMTINVGHIGLGVATSLGRNLDQLGDSTGGVLQGTTVSASIGDEKQRSVIDIGKRLLFVKLDEALSQRETLALLTGLERASREPSVTSVLIELDGFHSGMAQAQEVRQAIARLRARGKRVFAYLHVASLTEYFIASAADTIWLDPDGGLQVAGISSGGLYLRGLLDKIGVSPQFVKIAEYKTAPEMFTRSEPSDAAKEVREAILDGLFEQLVGMIASRRGIKPATLRTTIDQGPFTPPLALKAKLIDALVPRDRLRVEIQRKTAAFPTTLGALDVDSGRWPVGPGVAVIVLEGEIIRGKSRQLPWGSRMAGDETMVDAINWARRSSRVGAILLRVNSPGGSAIASARIFHALQKARKTKPVIVSIANVGASGGYYAAAAGDQIFALPATITGSIGIFTGKFDLSGLLKRLGINISTSQRGKRARLDAADRPYSAEERQFVERSLRYYYDRFIGAVATGRKLTRTEVDQVARGRVWTGAQAKGKRLVDQYGDFIQALNYAKAKFGRPAERRVPLFVLPKTRPSLLRRLVKSATQTPDVLAPLTKRVAERLPPPLFYAKDGEPLARMPFFTAP